MPDLPQPLLKGVAIRKSTDPYLPSEIDWSVDMQQLDRDMFVEVLGAELLYTYEIPNRRVKTIFESWAKNNPNISPDQIKLYPHATLKYTGTLLDFQNGSYKPYGTDIEVMNKMLLFAMLQVPYWVRINREYRDIPSDMVLEGFNNTCVRDELERYIRKNKLHCRDMRHREVRAQEIDHANVVLMIRRYVACGGDEYFISFESENRETLYAFLRLRLSSEAGLDNHGFVLFDELVGSALIRELHVYGEVQKVGNSASVSASQHIGFGRQLVQEAIYIAQEEGYNKIAVISGIGVKGYYRKLGFETGNILLTRDITNIDARDSNLLVSATKSTPWFTLEEFIYIIVKMIYLIIIWFCGYLFLLN